MEALKHSRRQFFTHPWACDSTPPPWLRYCWSRDIGPLLAATENSASHPLITVVLPVFNGGRYLEAAIASTLKASENFPLELIVVDDGSTDSTPTILNFYHDHPDVRVITQENAGLAAALTRGFAHARGAFLTWTSADNLFLGGALDELASYLLMNPSVAVAYADVQLIDESGHPARQTDYRPMDQQADNRSVLTLPADATTLSAWDDNFVNACFLYRRRHAMMAGGYRSDLRGYEDFDYWLRLARFGEVGHIFSDRPLYLYRLHDESQTSQLDAAKLRHSVHEHRLGLLQKQSEILAQPLEVVVSPQTCSQAASPQSHSAQSTRAAASRFLAHPEISTALHEIASVDAAPLTPRLHFLPCEAEFQHQLLKSLLLTTSGSSADRSCSEGSQIEISFESTNPRSSVQAAVPPTTLLPGLAIPTILRRARSSSFGAVVPPKNSRSIWGIFCPKLSEDSSVETKLRWLADAVTNLSQVCFVLIASSSAERAFADELNRRACKQGNPDNLRIIQLEDDNDAFRKHDTLLAYTYVLADLDWILSIKTEPLSHCACEVQCELGLAAAAGIGVMYAELPGFRQPATPAHPNPHLDGFGLLHEPPHLAILPLEGFYDSTEQTDRGSAISRSDLSLLRNFQYKTRPHLDHRTLEQWISSQAPAKFPQLVRELILARVLEAS